MLKGDEDDLLPEGGLLLAPVNKACVRGRDLKENLEQFLFLCGITGAT